MKKLYYLPMMISIFLVMSCRSIEKMVDEGRYDDAIQFATKKLAGEKNKKTKYVKSLEKAFIKVNKADMAKIEALKSRNDDRYWGEIYRISNLIAARQNKIYPFLPLISEDGYRAEFDFIPIADQLEEASTKAAAYHYELGSKKLSSAIANRDHSLARDAYYEFIKVKNYHQLYEDLDDRIKLAQDKATLRVLVKWEDATIESLPYNIVRSIDVPMLRNLNQKWVTYHTAATTADVFDLVTEVSIDAIDISPAYQEIERYVDNERIERVVEVRETIGADSIKVIETIKEVENITAEVEVIKRQKSSTLSGYAETRDFYTGEVIFRDRLASTVLFDNTASRFSGDERALSDNSRRAIRRQLLPFPDDYSMLIEGLTQINTGLEQHLRKIRT